MNPVETAELLRRIAHVDRYAPQPSADLAEGWAALLDDIGLDEALAVCRDHYRRTTDSIAPADIVAGVRARRRDVLERAPVPRHAPDPELMRRIEAIADRKAVEPTAALTTAAPDRAPRPDIGRARVEAAMRAGESKRRAAAARARGEDPDSGEETAS